MSQPKTPQAPVIDMAIINQNIYRWLLNEPEIPPAFATNGWLPRTGIGLLMWQRYRVQVASGELTNAPHLVHVHYDGPEWSQRVVDEQKDHSIVVTPGISLDDDRLSVTLQREFRARMVAQTLYLIPVMFEFRIPAREELVQVTMIMDVRLILRSIDHMHTTMQTGREQDIPDCMAGLPWIQQVDAYVRGATETFTQEWLAISLELALIRCGQFLHKLRSDENTVHSTYVSVLTLDRCLDLFDMHEQVEPFSDMVEQVMKRLGRKRHAARDRLATPDQLCSMFATTAGVLYSCLPPDALGNDIKIHESTKFPLDQSRLSCIVVAQRERGQVEATPVAMVVCLRTDHVLHITHVAGQIANVDTDTLMRRTIEQWCHANDVQSLVVWNADIRRGQRRTAVQAWARRVLAPLAVGTTMQINDLGESDTRSQFVTKFGELELPR